MTKDKTIELLDNLIGMVEDNHGNDYDKAIHMAIDALKAEDVVVVVRCKDCIYKEECGREVLVNEYDNDKAVDITGFLFYCSYGER